MTVLFLLSAYLSMDAASAAQISSEELGPSGQGVAGTADRSQTVDALPPGGVVPVKTSQTAPELEPGADPDNKLFSPFFRHVAHDQQQFWTSPKELRTAQPWKTVLPFTAFAAALVASDSWLSKQLPDAPSQLRRSQNISNAAAFALVGGTAGAYLFGRATHREHLREAGFLGGEALVNSLMVTYALKEITQRQRPDQGNGHGGFFQGGSSFTSEHAAMAWSVAGVFAHEYPGPLSQFAAYSLASAVTLTRVTSKQHFASDALLGSALGWYFARQIYRAHHDPELGGKGWGDFERDESAPRSTKNMGSPYVPVDSWVYPALDRLVALGYIQSAITGMRPWTRLECVRLLNEADDRLHGEGAGGSDKDSGGHEKEALALYNVLAVEFSAEIPLLEGEANRNFQLESVYSRTTGIAGKPLTDGFHFGQTIFDDQGRPFAQGVSSVNGLSLSAAQGPVTVYVRGEYESAPSIPALSLPARQFIANADSFLPLPPNTPSPGIGRFALLDAYAALNLDNWQLSFGRQSLEWGPSESGNLMFSANAAPLTMLRLDRVSPFKLPWVFGLMGPTRYEFFLGRLTGHDFIFGESSGLTGQWGVPLSDQPFIVGQKLNFRPTPNFEFGIDYTRVTAGTGQPFTFHQFLKSTVSLGNGLPGTPSDPGDIRSGIDFSYKIPGLRNWLTFYGDAFTEDEFSPLAYPRKSAFEGGIYLARIPHLPKLDLRAEGGSTSPVDFSTCNGCFYQNTRFINAYTNGGNLMGGWIGRASQGEQIWSTYWLSARNTIEVNYRHRKIDTQFVPGGGTVTDAGVKAGFWLGPIVRLTGSFQYEQWAIPLLDSTAKSNLTTSFEIGVWPRHWGVREIRSPKK